MKQLLSAISLMLALTVSAQAELTTVKVDMVMFAEYTIGCMTGLVKYENISRSDTDRLYAECMKWNVRDYSNDTFPIEFKRYVVAEFLYGN